MHAEFTCKWLLQFILVCCFCFVHIAVNGKSVWNVGRLHNALNGNADLLAIEKANLREESILLLKNNKKTNYWKHLQFDGNNITSRLYDKQKYVSAWYSTYNFFSLTYYKGRTYSIVRRQV